MSRVFIDTNILYPLWRRYVEHGYYLIGTAFRTYALTHSCYISTYVIDELRDISKRKGPYDQDDNLREFLLYCHIHVIASSVTDNPLIRQSVHDEDDYQILCDTVHSRCDYLFTRNSKDFDHNTILSQWNIRIIDKI